MEPRISICIPTYNRADLLEKTLLSVVNQRVKPYEVVVVDNCSDDNTEAVASRFPAVTYYRNERNLGFVGNWNKCIEVAKGDFLTILHSDDLISPHWVQEWCSVLKQYQASNVGAFFSDLFTIDLNENAKIFYKVMSKGGVLKEIENIKVLWKNNLYGTPVSGGLVIRKSVFQKIGLFEEQYRTETDVLTIFRLLNNFPVYYLPKHLFAYRIHPFQTFDKEKVKKGDEKKFNVELNYLGIVKRFYDTELRMECRNPEFYKRPALMYVAIAVFYFCILKFKKARKLVRLAREIIPDVLNSPQDYYLLITIIFHYVRALLLGRFVASFNRNIAKDWVRSYHAS